MSARLAGKVALVTGGASGIGRACALRFAADGADVVIADLNPERGRAVAAEVQAHGRRGHFVPVDVGEDASCEAMADTAVAAGGRIDIVVSAAGIPHAAYVSREGHEARPVNWEAAWRAGALINKPLADWERVLRINLTGVMLTDRAAARRMIAQGDGGSIINISSVGATLPFPGVGDYSVTKAGVWMLTKVLAAELAAYNIRVNAIGPGFIATPMNAAVRADPAGAQWMLDMTTMKRFGEPEEVAAAAAFLAGDDSRFVTGEILYTDGGIFTG